jgi:hypothetical protein
MSRIGLWTGAGPARSPVRGHRGFGTPPAKATVSTLNRRTQRAHSALLGRSPHLAYVSGLPNGAKKILKVVAVRPQAPRDVPQLRYSAGPSRVASGPEMQVRDIPCSAVVRSPGLRGDRRRRVFTVSPLTVLGPPRHLLSEPGVSVFGAPGGAPGPGRLRLEMLGDLVVLTPAASPRRSSLGRMLGIQEKSGSSYGTWKPSSSPPSSRTGGRVADRMVAAGSDGSTSSGDWRPAAPGTSDTSSAPSSDRWEGPAAPESRDNRRRSGRGLRLGFWSPGCRQFRFIDQ